MSIKGFKGFDKDFKCRDYQYEVGKEYKTNKAKACESGFHFCENPLDVFSYYPPSTSRFAEVEGGGETDKHNGDSKVACTTIKIVTEIGLSDIVTAGVDYILSNAAGTTRTMSTGNYSAATNTGYQSVSTNTGNYSAATNTGDYSAATNTGYQSVSTNTGNYSAATNTGYQSASTNTGNRSVSTNTGNRSVSTNTGDYSAATNTGNRSVSTNTGYQSASTNTGNYSAATNTGYQSVSTNTGNYSAATNTGDYSAATNTGYQSAAVVEGQQSIACGLGFENKAKGKKTCWIVLAEWKEDKQGGMLIKHVQSVKIDGKKIKEDTFYTLKDGKFTEVTQ